MCYAVKLYKRMARLKNSEKKEANSSLKQKGKLLSFTALHDLARACSLKHEDYIDPNGKHKFELNALQYGWTWGTTTEDLEVEDGLSLSL